MSPKAVCYSIGCVVAWFVLLPLVVVGGGLALFSYAIFAEIAAFMIGKSEKPLDNPAAREMARRLCMGSRAIRHQSIR